MVITVDGPAAAGKGTLTRALAKILKYRHLDSGRLYRSAAKHAEDKWKLKVPQQINEIAQAIEKKLQITDKYIQKVNNDKELNDERIAKLASLIAPQKPVRDALKKKQKAYIAKSNKGIILDGRDMGTVICPDATCKIFLTASQETRAKRRYKEILNAGKKAEYQKIFNDIKARDKLDTSRDQAPLKAAHDAIIIDSSDKTPDKVLDIVLQTALKHRKCQNGTINVIKNKKQ